MTQSSSFAAPAAAPEPAAVALQLLLGDATPVSATVYARLPTGRNHADGRLEGTIRGPHCTLSRMLPAEYPLVDCGAGPGYLARACIPDPCYWSPELPALYDVALVWRVAGEVRAEWRRTWGLRRLGIRGRHLWFEGRRWVLRGIRGPLPPVSEWPAWRELAVVAVVDEPTDEQCELASRHGLPLVACLGEPRAAEQPIRRCAAWPAVLGVVLPAPPDTLEQHQLLESAASGLLLMQSLPANALPTTVTTAAWVPAERLAAQPGPFAALERPIVAVRTLAEPRDLWSARQAIDDLQRDLAPAGDFAGYVVEAAARREHDE